MRLILVGLTLLLLSSAAGAQATGFVEAVGFDNHFRSNCWTPMLVNLTSQSSQTQDFQIQIVQQDLDKDNVTYTRDITLNAGAQQKFWACFIPQPTDHGLPAASMDQLQQVLRVYLSTRPDPSGRTKQLLQLPVRFTLVDLDPHSEGFVHPMAQKLVLCVTDGSSRPAGLDQSELNSIGAMEEVTAVSLHPRDLPENVLAYDAVDVVLWMSGNASELDEAGARRKEALEQFVRRGGHLVVCQADTLHRTDALADLLPVNAREVQLLDRPSLDPLPRLSVPRGSGESISPRWERLERTGTLRAGKAAPTDDAMVEDWIDWSADGADRTPWLARRTVGLGCVTWVAVDLGNSAITLTTPGWPSIWNHVFGWNSATQMLPVSEGAQKLYQLVDGSPPRDLSASLFAGTNHEGRGAGLLAVAIGFFVVYWLAAGPGTYLFLANRRKKELSWFVFGAAAIAATLLTVLVVKLILRGNPQVKHASVARTAYGEHTHVLSRIGLYIPRDGEQLIELQETAPDAQSCLSPLVVHPDDVPESTFPAAQDYTDAVHEPDEPVAIRIPFRSTLKKIEARWVGDTSGGLVGSPRLTAPAGSTGLQMIAGSLVNKVGHDLNNVYMFFRSADAQPRDWALFFPQWKDGETIDLRSKWDNAPSFLKLQPMVSEPDWGRQSARGWIDGQWSTYWYSYLSGKNVDAAGMQYRAELPMLSVFDLLPTPRNIEGQERAFTMLPRGGRNLNLSAAVRAGRLLILGEALTPLPCPLQVNGRKMAGDGQTVYEFVLPLDRSAVTEPANPGKKS